jgi:hypothetical protein
MQIMRGQLSSEADVAMSWPSAAAAARRIRPRAFGMAGLWSSLMITRSPIPVGGVEAPGAPSLPPDHVIVRVLRSRFRVTRPLTEIDRPNPRTSSAVPLPIGYPSRGPSRHRATRAAPSEDPRPMEGFDLAGFDGLAGCGGWATSA